MNRAAQGFSLYLAIILALLFSGAWRAGASGSRQDPKDKPPAAAAAPSNANSSPQTPAAPATAKKRIVVLDFDDLAVGTDVLGDKVDVGKGIAGLLVQQLIKEGTYLVIDSKSVSAALAEQNFSKSDRYDREFAVNLGKRFDADGVIMGSVTLFGRDRNARPIPHDEFVRKKIKARAAADARIVDVASGEIVAAASGRGESKREGINLTSGGSNWHNFQSGDFDFSSPEFQKTILGEAVNDMVAQLAAALAADASRLTSAAPEISGLVVSISAEGTEIVLNIGAKAGLKVGDQLKVERVVRDIPDPANGALSRLTTTDIGTVRVAEVHDAWSVAEKVSGGGGFKVGDHVTVVTH